MKQKMKTLLAVVILVVAVILKLWKGSSGESSPERDGSIASPEAGAFSGKFTPVKTSGAGLELLSKCRLISGRNSDGDSFHVKHEKGENQFRLYFVDTPESEYKEYRGGDNNGKRLDQQAEYFGGLSRDQVTKVGLEGKAFTLGLLKKKPFKVLTKWEDVVRPGREYCFVIVEWEGREVYLHELLVAHGLVRVHTKGTDMPQGKGWRAQRKYLESWEKEVKAQGIGAWGM